MIIERLVALFGVETDDSSFKDAGNKVKKLRGILKAATVAAAGLGAALVAGMQAFANEADQSIKHARKINLSVEALQELQFAGERAGMSANQMNTALQRLQRRTADAAKGMGPAVQAFAELGLNAEQLSRMETDQILERVIGALSKKPKQDWTRLLTALADIEGTEFAKLVESGLPALRELRKEAQKLGGVFTEEEAQRAEAYQDAMTNLKFTLSGIRNLLVVDVIPVVTSALGKATQFIAENREGIAFIAKTVGFIVGALSVLMFGKGAIVGGIIGALILAFEDIRAFFQGKQSITGLIVDKFAEAFNLVEMKWIEFTDKFKARWEEIIQTISDIIPDWMKELWEGAFTAQSGNTANVENSDIAQEALRIMHPQSDSNFVPAGFTAQRQSAFQYGNRQMAIPSQNISVTVPVSVNGTPVGEVKKEIKTDMMVDNANTTKVLSKGDQY